MTDDAHNKWYCNICDKMISKTNKAKHLKKMHVPNYIQETYICEICNRELTKNNKAEHMALHKNKNEIAAVESVNKYEMCELCRRGFITKIELKEHYLTKAHMDKIFFKYNEEKYKKTWDLQIKILNHKNIIRENVWYPSIDAAGGSGAPAYEYTEKLENDLLSDEELKSVEEELKNILKLWYCKFCDAEFKGNLEKHSTTDSHIKNEMKYYEINAEILEANINVDSKCTICSQNTVRIVDNRRFCETCGFLGKYDLFKRKEIKERKLNAVTILQYLDNIYDSIYSGGINPFLESYDVILKQLKIYAEDNNLTTKYIRSILPKGMVSLKYKQLIYRLMNDVYGKSLLELEDYFKIKKVFEKVLIYFLVLNNKTTSLNYAFYLSNIVKLLNIDVIIPFQDVTDKNKQSELNQTWQDFEIYYNDAAGGSGAYAHKYLPEIQKSELEKKS